MAGAGLPWSVLKRCFQLCPLTSLSFAQPSCFTAIDPYPGQDIWATLSSIRSLSYTAYTWREFVNNCGDEFGFMPHARLMRYQEEVALESQCMASLVPNLHSILESIDIPCESAPLPCMARLPWPKLRRFALRGRFGDPEDLGSLRNLLTAISPMLSFLSLEMYTRREVTSRFRLFDSQTPGTNAPQFQLRSLTLAYPDPDDAIFDSSGTQLIHLGLCDFPRFYYHRASELVKDAWSAPILSSAECLSILNRMQLPQLTSLVLVYIHDQSEDELLSFLTQSQALPQLSHLELHRYRTSYSDIVPFVRALQSFVVSSTSDLRAE